MISSITFLSVSLHMALSTLSGYALYRKRKKKYSQIDATLWREKVTELPMSWCCSEFKIGDESVRFNDRTIFVRQKPWPSPPDLAVWVQALAGDIVLCSWARHLTLTMPLSTQVYKKVPANLMPGVTLRALALYPGGTKLILVASYYGNRRWAPAWWATWLVCFC